MKKIYLFIPTFFLIQFSKAQQAVVALPAMNVVYIGLENPVQIAVEGYTHDQITVGCENCSISHSKNQNYVLKVSGGGICKLVVSYKKKKTFKTDTLQFRVKSVPKPVSKFGELESGPASVYELMNQHTINCVLPGFHYAGIAFKVTSYHLLYVPRIGAAEPFASNTDSISLDVKKLILQAKKGDKILVDDIQAYGPGGIGRRLNPIAITIQKNENNLAIYPDYYSYQPTKDSEIETTRYIDNNPKLFEDNETLIFKGYKIQCGDTQFVIEIKKNKEKTLLEKQYYPSGKLKAIYNFETNDTMGTTISYYENGKIKSEGKLITKNNLIVESYNQQFITSGFQIIDLQLLDSFLFTNYAPIGSWKAYYENGKTALECTLNLRKLGKIPTKDSGSPFDISKYGYNTSIKEAMESKDSYFKPAFSGSFKLYDREGQIIKEENFKD